MKPEYFKEEGEGKSLLPLITTFGGNTLNINTVSTEVMQILGLDETEIEMIMKQRTREAGGWKLDTGAFRQGVECDGYTEFQDRGSGKDEKQQSGDEDCGGFEQETRLRRRGNTKSKRSIGEKMPKILGVNIDSGSLNASLIDSTFRSVKHIKTERTVLPENREERNSVMLEALTKWQKELMPAGVVIGLPLQNFSWRTIEMPSMKKTDMHNALYFELEKYLPLPMDEYLFDFVVTGSGKTAPNMVKVLVFSIKKDILNGLSENCNRGGHGDTFCEVQHHRYPLRCHGHLRREETGRYFRECMLTMHMRSSGCMIPCRCI